METTPTKMSLGNKIFYIVLTLLIVGSVSATFYRIFILKDYQIIAESSCDPVSEECYAYTDEETGEVSYYKKVSKKAANIAICEATEEKLGCNEELTCLEGEESCSYMYCNPDSLEEGEVCAE